MTATSKLFTVVGVLLLLSLGLCGIGALHPSSSSGIDEFGSNIAYAGVALLVLAIVTLVFGVIGIVVYNIRSGGRKKP